MRFTMIVLALILSALPGIAAAEEPTITLRDLEQEALANNPEIRMTAKRTEALEDRKSSASGLPDPMIGYMVQNVGSPGTWSVGTEDMSMQGVVFTQEIPFPGKLGTRSRVAGQEALRAGDAARETKLRVLSELRNAYFDYYLAHRSVEILTETKDLMKNVERIAESRYATGLAMQQDAVRAQLEVSMLIDRIAEEEQKKESLAATVAKLAGRDPLAPLGRPEPLSAATFTRSIDELAEHALAHSPQLSGRKRMVEQSREELSLSRREYLPDMVVSGGWFTRGEKSDVWQASVMFKVPLWFWNKQADVAAASADLDSSRFDYDAVRLETLSRVRDLYSAIRTAEHHVHLYQAGIIPQARLALQSSTANYQVGKTDFLSLLDSESLLLKYQLMEQEELAGLNKKMAMMSELTGEEDVAQANAERR